MKIQEKIDELTEFTRLTQNGEKLSTAESNLCAIILDMLAVMNQLNKNIAQTANTASCLANGIQPD
jgi:hypothetical protein